MLVLQHVVVYLRTLLGANEGTTERRLVDGHLQFQAFDPLSERGDLPGWVSAQARRDSIFEDILAILELDDLMAQILGVDDVYYELRLTNDASIDDFLDKFGKVSMLPLGPPIIRGSCRSRYFEENEMIRPPAR